MDFSWGKQKAPFWFQDWLPLDAQVPVPNRGRIRALQRNGKIFQYWESYLFFSKFVLKNCWTVFAKSLKNSKTRHGKCQPEWLFSTILSSLYLCYHICLIYHFNLIYLSCIPIMCIQGSLSHHVSEKAVMFILVPVLSFWNCCKKLCIFCLGFSKAL